MLSVLGIAFTLVPLNWNTMIRLQSVWDPVPWLLLQDIKRSAGKVSFLCSDLGYVIGYVGFLCSVLVPFRCVGYSTIKMMLTLLTMRLYVMAYPIMQTRLVCASLNSHNTILEDRRVLRLKFDVDGNKRERVKWRRILAVVTADHCERVVGFHYIFTNTRFVGFLSTCINAQRTDG